MRTGSLLLLLLLSLSSWDLHSTVLGCGSHSVILLNGTGEWLEETGWDNYSCSGKGPLNMGNFNQKVLEIDQGRPSKKGGGGGYALSRINPHAKLPCGLLDN